MLPDATRSSSLSAASNLFHLILIVLLCYTCNLYCNTCLCIDLIVVFFAEYWGTTGCLCCFLFMTGVTVFAVWASGIQLKPFIFVFIHLCSVWCLTGKQLCNDAFISIKHGRSFLSTNPATLTNLTRVTFGTSLIIKSIPSLLQFYLVMFIDFVFSWKLSFLACRSQFLVFY